MTNQIATQQELNDALDAARANGTDVHVGDMYVNQNGDILRIGRLYVESDYRNDSERVRARLERWGGRDDENNDVWWDGYGIHSLNELMSDIKSGTYIRLHVSPHQATQTALQEFSHLERYAEEDVAQVNTESAMVLADASRVLQHKAVLEEHKRKVELIERLARKHLERFRNIAHQLAEKLAEIHKIIGVFELYLGVHEQIIQIQEGLPALENEPVTIRQLVLYMDEEYGDPRKDPLTGVAGIDWQSVEDFDRWLVKHPKHLRQVAPEAKCIVALKPSRTRRSYSENVWVDAEMNAKNARVYLLIRNGENVYRIWTEAELSEKLFPSEDEMGKLEEKKGEWGFEGRDAEKKQFNYKRNVAMLQGILDRTPILQPMPHAVNLFDATTYGNAVRLIRDADPSLTNGQETFAEWHKRLNAGLHVGSRVVMARYWKTNSYERDYNFDRNERYARNYKRGTYDNPYYDMPPPPPVGVYTIEAIEPDRSGKRERDALVIYYNPRDEVGTRGWIYEPHERKNRLSFRLYRNDLFVLAYDKIDLATVERLIADRTERAHYLEIMPTLYAIKSERAKEIAYEKQFVALVAARNNVTEQVVWNAVTWWKHKNKWQRAIGADDALALRMIERRIQSKTFARQNPRTVELPKEQ